MRCRQCAAVDVRPAVFHLRPAGQAFHPWCFMTASRSANMWIIQGGGTSGTRGIIGGSAMLGSSGERGISGIAGGTAAPALSRLMVSLLIRCRVSSCPQRAL